MFRHISVMHAKLVCAESSTETCSRSSFVLTYMTSRQTVQPVLLSVVVKAFGPSLDDAETACVVDLSTFGRHASAYVLWWRSCVCNIL